MQHLASIIHNFSLHRDEIQRDMVAYVTKILGTLIRKIYRKQSNFVF